MLTAVLLYLAWVWELSGLTRTTEGLYWPNALLLVLVYILWKKSGASAVLWGGAAGLLLDLAHGLTGVHLLLASTLALAATDWREACRRSGPALAVQAALVLSGVLLGGRLWMALTVGEFHPSRELAWECIGPATATALAAMVVRGSCLISRGCVSSMLNAEGMSD